jgi:hypothetical protein
MRSWNVNLSLVISRVVTSQILIILHQRVYPNRNVSTGWMIQFTVTVNVPVWADHHNIQNLIVTIRNCKMYRPKDERYKSCLVFRRSQVKNSRAPVSTDSTSAVYCGPKEIWKWNKRFITFKTRAKRERAVSWWNPAAPVCPVLDSSSFAPIHTLPRGTCLRSASSVLAVHIICYDITVFVFRKPLFIN